MSHGKKWEYIWMKVTLDEYELPLVVADTVEELARKCNTKSVNILSHIYHSRERNGKCCYVRVKIPYEKEVING